MQLQQKRLMPTFGLAFFMLVSLSACQQKTADNVKLEGMVGTAMWHATIVQPAPAVDVDVLQTGLDKTLSQANQMIATWQPDSEISQFNQYQGQDWFPVSPALAQLVQTTLAVSEQSNGVYDVTIGPLIKLWGFSANGTAQDHVPAPADIDAARAKVGYHKLAVRLNPAALRKTQADVRVELASVADGFAVDQAGQYLEAQGVKNYMVEVAGEIRTRGLSQRGDAWRIGIEKPIDLARDVQMGIALDNAGLATSGDYRNFFTENGKRYSHTVDPASGYPVQHSLASVSVIAEQATLADAYATLLMALGEEKGKTFADQQGLKAYFIWRTDHGFATYATSSFPSALQ